MKLRITLLATCALCAFTQTRVTTPLGALEGTESSGIRTFRGVPFSEIP